MTSILWIYTAVDSYNPSHIAALASPHTSPAYAQINIETLEEFKKEDDGRMEKETSLKVFEKIKFGHKFRPSFRMLLNLLTNVA